MQHCIVALSALFLVANVTTGMPSAPVGPPGAKRSISHGGASMPALPPYGKRSEASMPASPNPPPMPMKRAPEGLIEDIEIDLPGEPQSRTDAVNNCPRGPSYQDGCDNTCTCTGNGIYTCTEKGCPENCPKGPSYQDGCNTCTCEGNGIYSCTEDLCINQGTHCKDQSPHCAYWSTNGECDKNPEYMTLFCKASCGACDKETSTTAPALKPEKRAPEAVPELRTSDASINHNAIVSDWQNINVPTGTVDTIKNDLPGEPLSPADFENAVTLNLPEVDLGQKIDPIELANKFEGDIIIMDKSELANLTQRNGRNAMINNNKRWSNGVVPYVISSAYNKKERATIAVAMKSYHDHTCLRFVPRTIEKNYIHILKSDGCSSSVGRVGGAQAVSLGVGCLYSGIVMHELMHAVGFWHEQSRNDRDRFITINWLNIQNGMDFNFKKFTWENIQSLGVQYDTGSIMHYGAYAFAKDRSKPTIIVHKSGVEIGQRRALSNNDLSKLNKFYECSGVDNSGGGGGGNSIVKPTPVKPPQPNSCIDNNQYCSQWKDTGECEKNSAWMNINCKKSCGQCGTPCKDESAHCSYWKSTGECNKNAEYMTLFCKASCGACHGKDDHNTCGDHNKHCEIWASQEQCRSNPNYMLLYCKKSCGQC